MCWITPRREGRHRFRSHRPVTGGADGLEIVGGVSTAVSVRNDVTALPVVECTERGATTDAETFGGPSKVGPPDFSYKSSRNLAF